MIAVSQAHTGVAGDAQRAAAPSVLRRIFSDARRRSWLIVIALMLIPVAILVARLPSDGPYANWSDGAVLELQTRDIGRHIVWLGPYSRFGFSHPGPMLFYLFAVPYWITGGRAFGLNLGALLINAVAIGLLGWLAYRRGRMLFLAATFSVVNVFLLEPTITPMFLRSPWNPDVTVLPCMLFVFVVWECSRGTRWAIPMAIVVGSFLAQTHLGFVPFVAALSVGGCALGWRRWRTQWRSSERPALQTVLRWSAGLFGVLWVLPIIEQCTRLLGNVTRIAGFQVRHSGDHSIAEGVTLVSRFVGGVPAWLTGSAAHADGTYGGSALFAIPIVLIGAAAVVIAWRRTAMDTVRFATLTGLACVVAMVSVSRIVWELDDYLVRWMQIPALLLWLIPIVAIADPNVGIAMRWRTWLGRAMAVVFLITASVVTVRVATAPPALRPYEREVRTLASAVALAAAHDGDRTVIIEEGSDPTYATEWAVAMELERRGIRTRFPRNYVDTVTVRHVVSAGTQGLHVAFGPERDRVAMAAKPGARYLASSGGLDVFVVAPTGR